MSENESESKWATSRRLGIAKRLAEKRAESFRATLETVLNDFSEASRLLNRMHPTCWEDECEICTLIGRSGHEFSEPKRGSEPIPDPDSAGPGAGGSAGAVQA